ncbi:conserved protein of unknown function [Limnospira indica PCC 8005]|uniref:Uncharacterized protein n=1 Tax=Limnospira indica PCC 8005 TaxID=376219 RepID=A0A9P1KII6_9CYAN|nr:conserved protein of unknown function [Limnospira indica PCC 8005]
MFECQIVAIGGLLVNSPADQFYTPLDDPFEKCQFLTGAELTRSPKLHQFRIDAGIF